MYTYKISLFPRLSCDCIFLNKQMCPIPRDSGHNLVKPSHSSISSYILGSSQSPHTRAFALLESFHVLCTKSDWNFDEYPLAMLSSGFPLFRTRFFNVFMYLFIKYIHMVCRPPHRTNSFIR